MNKFVARMSVNVAVTAAAAVVLFATAAHAVVSPAPAPLLAAGIPAFMAVGGGALIARLRRRKK